MEFLGFSNNSKVKKDRVVSELGDQEREVQPSRCMYLDGTGWNVNINNISFNDNKGSGTLWFKAPNTQINAGNTIPTTFLGNYGNSTIWREFGLTNDNYFGVGDAKVYELRVGQIDSLGVVKSNGNYIDDKWHFLYWEAIYINNEDSTLRVWIDNYLILDLDFNKQLANIGLIGRKEANDGQSYLGYLYDVRIFSERFLNSVELEKVKEGKSVNEDRWYKLDEVNGNIAYNSVDGFAGAIDGGSSDISTVHVTDADLPFNFHNTEGYNNQGKFWLDNDVKNWRILNVENIDYQGDKIEFNSYGARLEIPMSKNIYTSFYYVMEGYIELLDSGYTPTIDLFPGDGFNEFSPGYNGEFEEGFTATADITSGKLIIRFNHGTPGLRFSVGKNFELRHANYFPKDPNSLYNDILGNRLEYRGQVKYNAKFKQSNCLEFDGDSYVDFGDVPEFETNNFKFSCWFIWYGDSNNNVIYNHQFGHDKNNGLFRGFIIAIRESVNGLTFNPRFGDIDNKHDTSDGSINLNEWYYLEFIFSHGVTSYHLRNLSGTFEENGDKTISVSDLYIESPSTYGTLIGARYSDDSIRNGENFNGQIINLKFTDLDTNQELLNVPFSEGAGTAIHNVAQNAPSGSEVAQLQTSNDVSNLWKKQDYFHYNLLNGFRKEYYKYSDVDFKDAVADRRDEYHPDTVISYIENGVKMSTSTVVNEPSGSTSSIAASILEIPYDENKIELVTDVTYKVKFKFKVNKAISNKVIFQTVGGHDKRLSIDTTNEVQVNENIILLPNEFYSFILSIGITFDPTGYIPDKFTVDVWDIEIEQLSYIPLKGNQDPYGNTSLNRITNPASRIKHNLAETKLDFRDGKPNDFNRELPDPVSIDELNGNLFKRSFDNKVDNIIVQNETYAKNSVEEGRLRNLVKTSVNDPVSWGILTVKTDLNAWSNDNQVLLALDNNDSHDFIVEWGDGTSDYINDYTQEEKLHTYSQPGIYNIIIKGTLRNLDQLQYFPDDDGNKFIDVIQWGGIILGGGFFRFWRNLNNISAIDAPNIVNLSQFTRGSNFNTPVNHWDIKNVTSSNLAFRQSTFNQPLDKWDTSNIVNMKQMFYDSPFNQDISMWDVSNVQYMENMFYDSSFDQNIGSWDIKNVTNMSGMFDNSAMSVRNYDLTLQGWSRQNNVPTGITLGADGLQYSATGKLARDILINQYGWDIQGDEYIG